jgi:F-type H+-transporting ATPase subunit epsilon
MAVAALPTSLTLEVVTPEGLLLREEAVDEVIAPGELGSFGVRPGHTPFLSILGVGELRYRQGGQWHHLTCFWGFAEVQPDRVNILAEVAERVEDIDAAQPGEAVAHAAARVKMVHGEAGWDEAHQDYVRLVTRLAADGRPKAP